MKKIYLDYAATTPMLPEVFDATKPYLTEQFGNASSIHEYGREARAALDESRDVIANLIGAHPSEIFFVGSGTEANNFALKGVAWNLRRHGKTHLITSKAEHHSVLETLEYLEGNGFEVTYLEVDNEGKVNINDVRKAITPKTSILSVMHANNEIGTINPMSEFAKAAREHGVVSHTDAVQSFGKIPFDVNTLNIDLLSLSGHKIYGPKGIGVLYIRRGVEIDRLIHGGGQERGRRAGTENVANVVGFSKAAALICNQRESERKRLDALRNMLRTAIQDKFPFIIFNGHPVETLPHILNISFDSSKIEIDGESVLQNLDLNGVAVSSGSACTSGSVKPSHVLLAMGRDEQTAKASIRFSLGRSTTSDDLEYVVNILGQIVNLIGRIKK